MTGTSSSTRSPLEPPIHLARSTMVAKSTMLCTANHTLRIVRKSRPAATGARARARNVGGYWYRSTSKGPMNRGAFWPGRAGSEVLGRIEDIHARWREASRLGVGAQAAVSAEERAIRQDRQVGARFIEHEVAQTRGIDRRRAEHRHDGDDCRPVQPLIPDRAGLLRCPPDDDRGAARDERARDLPRHAHRREADNERRADQTRCKYEDE